MYDSMSVSLIPAELMMEMIHVFLEYGYYIYQHYVLLCDIYMIKHHEAAEAVLNVTEFRYKPFNFAFWNWEPNLGCHLLYQVEL